MCRRNSEKQESIQLNGVFSPFTQILVSARERERVNVDILERNRYAIVNGSES